MDRRGFTLIELLIVVAIIGILAAIAIPNFLEAQTRSKVAHAQAELRNAATALEAYYVDNEAYPHTARVNIIEQRWKQLTTPVAYFTSGIDDPFGDDVPVSEFDPVSPPDTKYASYDFITDKPEDAAHHAFFEALWAMGYPQATEWYTASQGPDTTIGIITYGPSGYQIGLRYDATNGTVSDGDIIRTGP